MIPNGRPLAGEPVWTTYPQIPVMLGVFINPGRRPDQPEPSPQIGWGDGFTNRGTEYNSLDDK